MKSLAGKTAIISGGSDGIGLAIANRLAAEGAHVVICARNAEKLSEVSNAISKNGGSCEMRVQDVGDSEGYAAMINDIAKARGLHILVNNAPHVGYGMITDTDLNSFRENFRVNMDAPFMGTQAAMKHMSANGGGSIVNIASINGERAMQGMSGYSASKAALLHFTRLAAMEGAASNVRVNAVVPGPIMTPGTRTYFDSDPAAGAAIANANPMGRIGDPSEVANAVLFLAGDQSTYITGATLPVDGGKTNELYVPV